MTQTVTIIGAGLAGSEAAYQLLKRGFQVEMVEMRPLKTTPAHTTDLFGELVCSNSLRSDDAETNAVGLMHKEMRRCDSLIMKVADETAVPAGGALAVNREEFARKDTSRPRSFRYCSMISGRTYSLSSTLRTPFRISSGSFFRCFTVIPCRTKEHRDAA